MRSNKLNKHSKWSVYHWVSKCKIEVNWGKLKVTLASAHLVRIWPRSGRFFFEIDDPCYTCKRFCDVFLEHFIVFWATKTLPKSPFSIYRPRIWSLTVHRQKYQIYRPQSSRSSHFPNLPSRVVNLPSAIKFTIHNFQFTVRNQIYRP